MSRSASRITPTLLELIREDLQAVLERDPSCSGRGEALLHAGWQGLALHRLAHRLHRRGHRPSAAALTRLARLLTGMEIHAGACIGRRAFIDHGFGVVIGETAVVGDDVTLYHGVTLGSRGWLHDSGPGRRRHPVIGDRVMIGTGASVLGPVTVGDDCRITAHGLVLRNLPAPTTHHHPSHHPIRTPALSPAPRARAHPRPPHTSGPAPGHPAPEPAGEGQGR
ncbi:serine O-acetyltransferase EpsC [Streptomyces europaeiscabiei]|uniref:serine O-acetyltransferase EpsC n=1 Tax=Streptomyces europaeiscabiei TaxID=146819 RepID=UPI002E0E16B3|nr:serine O-acetyltransferase [Streptomyces europaeiscabiei]WSG28303.1 serine O-acetyltransferase [Streptomyces europaeiscabiei]